MRIPDTGRKEGWDCILGTQKEKARMRKDLYINVCNAGLPRLLRLPSNAALETESKGADFVAIGGVCFGRGTGEG